MIFVKMLKWQKNVMPPIIKIMKTVLELSKLAIIGIVSGLLSYYLLSSRKHKSEKWWELRITAYQEAITVYE
jgi:hypothetical protein